MALQYPIDAKTYGILKKIFGTDPTVGMLLPDNIHQAYQNSLVNPTLEYPQPPGDVYQRMLQQLMVRPK
jgi:hypothetical protein